MLSAVYCTLLRGDDPASTDFFRCGSHCSYPNGRQLYPAGCGNRSKTPSWQTRTTSCLQAPAAREKSPGRASSSTQGKQLIVLCARGLQLHGHAIILLTRSFSNACCTALQGLEMLGICSRRGLPRPSNHADNCVVKTRMCCIGRINFRYTNRHVRAYACLPLPWTQVCLQYHSASNGAKARREIYPARFQQEGCVRRACYRDVHRGESIIPPFRRTRTYEL